MKFIFAISYIQPVHIRSIDLNLLPILRALFVHRNVSLAAAELGLSQPAVSHALSRLRHQYKDPLFRRLSSRMEPTPRAHEIIGSVAEALDLVMGTFESEFDLKKLNRTFRVALVSYSGFYVLPALIEEFRREAPNVQILPETMEEAAAYVALERSEIDLALGIFWNKGLPYRRFRLFSGPFVVIMRRDHPIRRRRISAQDLLAHSHVRVPILDNVDDILAAHGVQRQFAMTCPDVLAAPLIVSRSDLLAILPSALAVLYAEICDVREFAANFELPPCEIEIIVHQRNDSDPALAWLAERSQALAADFAVRMDRTVKPPRFRRKAI